MNSPLPQPAPAQRRDWTHRLVNLLVAVVVVAVAAAAFVFSYDGVHAIALLGGVSAQLARYYPGLFDAVLVIACVAAITLRDGRWWARLWAWLVIIVLLAAIGTTDVLHAMNDSLRHRTTEGIVAAAPVVAVLLAFSLLLTMLRQSRTRAGEPAVPGPSHTPALPAAPPAWPIALPPAQAASATAPTEAMPVPEDWTVPEWTARGAAPTRDVHAAAAPVGPPVSLPPPTGAMTGPEDSPATNVAPVREDHVAPAPEVPSAATQEPTHPAIESNKVISSEAAPSEAPTAGASPAQDEPASPTVQVPALSPESMSERTVQVRRQQGIRYAGSGVRGTAGKQAAEREGPRSEDYWNTEEAGQFAGLVYPAREDEPDVDAGDAGDVSDAETGGAAPRKVPPELDDDAPPFATAPFAAVPRLNRVRSTPAPPADEDEDEDEDEA